MKEGKNNSKKKSIKYNNDNIIQLILQKKTFELDKSFEFIYKLRTNFNLS